MKGLTQSTGSCADNFGRRNSETEHSSNAERKEAKRMTGNRHMPKVCLIKNGKNNKQDFFITHNTDGYLYLFR